jgi:hypothetical protein
MTASGGAAGCSDATWEGASFETDHRCRPQRHHVIYQSRAEVYRLAVSVVVGTSTGYWEYHVLLNCYAAADFYWALCRRALEDPLWEGFARNSADEDQRRGTGLPRSL